MLTASLIFWLIAVNPGSDTLGRVVAGPYPTLKACTKVITVIGKIDGDKVAKQYRCVGQ